MRFFAFDLTFTLAVVVVVGYTCTVLGSTSPRCIETKLFIVLFPTFMCSWSVVKRIMVKWVIFFATKNEWELNSVLGRFQIPTFCFISAKPIQRAVTSSGWALFLVLFCCVCCCCCCFFFKYIYIYIYLGEYVACRERPCEHKKPCVLVATCTLLNFLLYFHCFTSYRWFFLYDFII